MLKYFCNKQKTELFSSECGLCFKNGPRAYETRAQCVADNAKRLGEPNVLIKREKVRKTRKDKGVRRK